AKFESLQVIRLIADLELNRLAECPNHRQNGRQRIDYPRLPPSPRVGSNNLRQGRPSRGGDGTLPRNDLFVQNVTLGQKRTYAVQKVMSALLPLADIWRCKTDVC